VLKFGKPWYQLSGPLAAQAIVELQKEYDRVNSWRRSRARRLIGGYQNRNLNVPFAREDAGGFTWGDGVEDDDDGGSRYRLVRNKFYEYVETYVSKVGADENPQPALMVTDGDWTLKRQVTLATRLLEAEYDQRQGLYSDAYALARHGLRLAWGGTGSVAAKIYPWPKEDRVVIELHDTLDMFLDDTELAYNNPRTFGEKTWWPPERLAQSYPAHRKAIEDAVKPRDDLGLAYNEVFGKVEMVPVYEAWAVKLGDEIGRHIAVLEDGTVLVDEEWDDEEPPYAFFHASPSMVGFWGTPPTEYVYDEILKVNEIVQACDFAHTHTDKRVHYVYEQAITDIAEIEGVRGVKVVRTKVPNYQPAMENPQPFNRIDLDLLANHEAAIARTLGIDEMHSGARAEPGLPSAVAQREAASRFDDRAADGHRAFQHWVAVDFARHILKAQRRLYENNRAFKREWTGEFFSKEIHAKDIVDLDYNALRVRIKPIGEKKNTPEERVQFAQELMEQGAIPYEAYAAVLEHYDTPGETRVIKTQRRWIAWQIDTWLMTKDAEPVKYMSPRPWMRKSDALVQVIDALMEAEMNDVPADRLQYFLDFVAELVQQMSNEVNPPQAPAPPLGVLPPAQGAAGMNAGAQGLMAPGLVPGAPAPAAPPMAPPPGAPIV
jgi:hypothetical protein